MFGPGSFTIDLMDLPEDMFLLIVEYIKIADADYRMNKAQQPENRVQISAASSAARARNMNLDLKIK